ncbi:MAG: hypothetical protein WC007_00255 [Pelobacteraceae bacterium]
MKKKLAVLLVAVVTWSIVSVAMAETDVQAVKEKTVAQQVKKRSASEKMLPAPEVQLKRLSKGLKLTAEQQKQIRPMLKDEYAQLLEIRKDDNLSPKQIQAKVEVLRTETIAKMQAVMTPEQIEKHNLVSKEIKANKQKRIQENRKARLGTNASPPVQHPKP